jgi:hypothetical protein
LLPEFENMLRKRKKSASTLTKAKESKLSSQDPASKQLLFTGVRRETVWKMAEGFSTVRSQGQEAADRILFTPLGSLRSLNSALISIFQTVSEGLFSEVLGILMLF